MGYTNILIKKIAYSFGKILPDKLYLSIRYMITFKKKINWKDPRSFNEKIQWLKMYDRKPEYVEMVDKATVKSYISKKIGEQYVIPTLGVWDSFEEIDFDILPDKFVLKCTHDSGSVILCKDKSKFDIAAAGNKLSKCLKHNTYYGGREWVYKDIKPRIIAEKLLEDLEGENVLDYKFFCFNGHVKYFKIDFDRFNDHRANYYDLSMHQLPFGEIVCLPDYNKKFSKPEKYEEMIRLAEILSSESTFMRVDFYNLNGNILFGEITLYPGCGFIKFIPEEWDNKLGLYIELPKGEIR